MPGLIGPALERLRQRKFVYRTILISLGTALGQGLLLLVAPVLTRLFTPAQFGYLSIYISIVSLVGMMGAFRYEIALPLTEDNREANNLLSLCLGLLFFWFLLSSLVLALSKKAVAGWLGSPGMEGLMWIVPVGVVGSAGMQILMFFGMRANHYEKLTISKFVHGAATATAQISFGLLGFGPAGLLLGDALGRIASWTTLLALLKRVGKFAPGSVSAEGMLKAAKRYKSFPMYSSAGSLVNAAALQLPALYMGAMFGPEVAGWFGLGNRVLGIPVNLVGLSLSQVFMNEAGRLATTDPAKLKRLFFKLTTMTFVFGSIPLILISTLGPQIFGFVFGPSWVEAGRYIRVTAFFTATQFAVIPVSQTLNMLERNRAQLFWEAGRLAAVIGGFALAGSAGFTTTETLMVYSAVMVVSYAVLYVAVLATISTRVREARAQ